MIFVLSQGRLREKRETMVNKDFTEKLDNSIINHGKLSDRIYIMHFSHKDANPSFIKKLDILAAANAYTKIFAKVPSSAIKLFIENGYKQEACIKEFFREEDGYFLAKYFDCKREKDNKQDTIDNVLQLAKSKVQDIDSCSPIAHSYKIEQLKPKDAPQITEIYKTVFASYPFPIHDEDYIVKTMADNLIYFGIRNKDKIIAIASCEMDTEEHNAEMTDFATLDEYRGNSIAHILLCEMEKEMKKLSIKTLYTIARAYSFGMNITFAKSQYTYVGTLINNTNIGGQIESMNVWYKILS